MGFHNWIFLFLSPSLSVPASHNGFVDPKKKIPKTIAYFRYRGWQNPGVATPNVPCDGPTQLCASLATSRPTRYQTKLHEGRMNASKPRGPEGTTRTGGAGPLELSRGIRDAGA